MTVRNATPMIGTPDERQHTPTATARLQSARIRILTRKLHNYLGLYLLLFLWLFSVSGLVLNHSKWRVAQFWKARQETVSHLAIHVPTGTGDLATATDLMRQLRIVGELGETSRSPDGSHVDFQVVRPGHVFRVQARLDSVRATVTEIRLNAWGVMDALHKFTGVRMDAPALTRDWLLTRIWSFAMDALACGLVALVLSGLYMWYRLPGKRLPGLAALLLGLASCAFFLYGLGALVT
ncbi:hypothetical protein BH11GEM1_BH11GEM1_17110 [soil metagenome]